PRDRRAARARPRKRGLGPEADPQVAAPRRQDAARGSAHAARARLRFEPGAEDHLVDEAGARAPLGALDAHQRAAGAPAHRLVRARREERRRAAGRFLAPPALLRLTAETRDGPGSR